MVKVGNCELMHKKWTFRVGLTKKTSNCKSRDFLRKRRLKKYNCISSRAGSQFYHQFHQFLYQETQYIKKHTGIPVTKSRQRN